MKNQRPEDKLPLDTTDATDILAYGIISALRQFIQALELFRRARRAALTTPPNQDGGKAA